MTLFVTSPGTEQGKTYVTQLLCRQNPGLKAIKPVISGYEHYEGSDAALILSAMRKDEQELEQCTPWRFKAPLSPDYAAMLEKREIDYPAMVDFCKQAEPHIIEGAGGIMSPITQQHTNLDLLADTCHEAIIVSGLFLGCISQVLTAAAVIRQKNIPIRSVILSPNSPEQMDSEIIIASLAPQLGQDIPIITLKYLPNFEQSWQAQPVLL
jgi:dethiobiotin synthetase